MNPETKKLYPKDWPRISKKTIQERGGKCQECGRTKADGIVLTVHHLDGNPANEDPENYYVVCQGCHFRIQTGHWVDRKTLQFDFMKYPEPQLVRD